LPAARRAAPADLAVDRIARVGADVVGGAGVTVTASSTLPTRVAPSITASSVAIGVGAATCGAATSSSTVSCAPGGIATPIAPTSLADAHVAAS
jgi:hypothetical protein